MMTASSRELTVKPSSATDVARSVPSLSNDLRVTARWGFAIVVLFFFIGIGWAATAPLSGAIIASGVVSPSSSIQAVQHLEGGIIQDIQIKEGEYVEAGDILMILKDVSAKVDVAALKNQLRVLAAREARLHAERVGADSIDFLHPSLAKLNDAEVQAVIQQERNQFETRRANDESRKAILSQRIAQFQQQIVGARRQIESVRQQMTLIREEIGMLEGVVAKGYEQKPRLLQLQRKEAEVLGEEGELVARVAQLAKAIGETRLQMISLRSERAEEIDEVLTSTQADRFAVETKIRESTDRLTRTAIMAPVSGTVYRLHFRTIGGVIGPGDTVLELVPADDELIIDARVSPQDIDEVRAGASAYIIFPSYPQRRLRRINGEVIRVSPDVIENERTGEPFYETKVHIQRTHIEEIAPEIELTPGLPAEVYIATIDRTVLEYLLQPFLQSLERTFRE